MYDYRKNHSFDYMDVCWQSDVSAFQYAISVCHSFLSKKQASFNLMTAVTVGAILETKENLSLFPLFPHLFAMK